MDEIYWTAQQTCWFHGISAPTLGEWVKSGFPKAERNRYPAKAGNDWVKGNILQKEEHLGNISEERLLRERAKRIQDEIKAKRMAGEVVPKDHVLVTYGTLIAEAKASLLGLSRRLAPTLAPKTDEKEIEFELNEEIWKILNNLQKPLAHDHTRIARHSTKKRTRRKLATSRKNHYPRMDRKKRKPSKVNIR